MAELLAIPGSDGTVSAAAAPVERFMRHMYSCGWIFDTTRVVFRLDTACSRLSASVPARLRQRIAAAKAAFLFMRIRQRALTVQLTARIDTLAAVLNGLALNNLLSQSV